MTNFTLNCPTPLHYEQIVLAHGGGGRLMQQLLDSTVQPIFNNPLLQQKQDCAVFPIGNQKLAFTTDSYVINPVFFAGGDIGKLAVCGTLNDLAMSGAKPLYLSCGLILEEGFAIADLKRILQSMQTTAEGAGVSIVTGATGDIYEQQVMFKSATDITYTARRIMVELKQKNRNGDDEIRILCNLEKEAADAIIYRGTLGN